MTVFFPGNLLSRKIRPTGGSLARFHEPASDRLRRAFGRAPLLHWEAPCSFCCSFGLTSLFWRDTPTMTTTGPLTETARTILLDLAGLRRVRSAWRNHCRGSL